MVLYPGIIIDRWFLVSKIRNITLLIYAISEILTVDLKIIRNVGIGIIGSTRVGYLKIQ